MEEAQTKLKVLIEKAEKQKIDLRKLNAIRKRGSLLMNVGVRFKFGLCFVVALMIYGQFGNLLDSEKVKAFLVSFIIDVIEGFILPVGQKRKKN